MRGTIAKKLRHKVLDFMTRRKIDMKLFKNNYRRVKKAYVRGAYAL